MLTKSTGVTYDGDALCPLWRQTLDEIFQGDADLIRFAQVLFGQALLGKPTLQYLVLLIGTGSNGKSLFIETLRRVIGDYFRTVPAEVFATSKPVGGTGPQENLTRLAGARLIVASESDEGATLREGLVKSLTGSDTIAARPMYARHTLEIEPTWLAVLVTNHAPIIKGDDFGIWRRVLPIKFRRQFEGKDCDPYRLEKLKAEDAGILNWLIDGAMEFKRTGLCALPESVAEGKSAYRGNMDVLGDWLSECIDQRHDLAESNTTLWRSWERWAKDHGELPLIPTQRHLARRLSSRFTPIKDSRGVRGRGFSGLGLKDDFDDFTDP
jgi:P4 family phage/plasmid primase-like protien